MTENLPNKEKYNLISQIEGTSVFISSNIAEDASRNSEKDFARFVEISLGSAFECENLLIISIEVVYSKEVQIDNIIEDLHIIQKMLNSLYGKLTNRN